MATKFNREAFATSPFMRALLDPSALTDAERKCAEREQRRHEKDAVWRAMWNYDVAFHEACAATRRAILARHDTTGWHPGDPRVADTESASEAAFQRLYQRMEHWALLPKATKDQRRTFLRALEDSREAVQGPDQWAQWTPARDRWRQWVVEQGETSNG